MDLGYFLLFFSFFFFGFLFSISWKCVKILTFECHTLHSACEIKDISLKETYAPCSLFWFLIQLVIMHLHFVHTFGFFSRSCAFEEGMQTLLLQGLLLVRDGCFSGTILSCPVLLSSQPASNPTKSKAGWMEAPVLLHFLLPALASPWSALGGFIRWPAALQVLSWLPFRHPHSWVSSRNGGWHHLTGANLVPTACDGASYTTKGLELLYLTRVLWCLAFVTWLFHVVCWAVYPPHHINPGYGIGDAGLASWMGITHTSQHSLSSPYLPHYYLQEQQWKRSHRTSQAVQCKCFLLSARLLKEKTVSTFIQGDHVNFSLFCCYLMGTLLAETSHYKTSSLREVSPTTAPEKQLEIRIQKTYAKNMSA